jgi:hypothetical protein
LDRFPSRCCKVRPAKAAPCTGMKTAFLRSMSMKDAQKAASEWLGTLKLGRDLTGQTIDLTPHLPALAFEGTFRRMVLQAVTAKLKKRGAKEVIGGVV